MADSDPAMNKIKAAFDKSKLSLVELGRRMGYEDDGMAKKSAWQFLNKTNDPRLSMLRKFAKAVGVKVESLVK
jgi:transcriptional regulator with XRE-family HTH domain